MLQKYHAAAVWTVSLSRNHQCTPLNAGSVLTLLRSGNGRAATHQAQKTRLAAERQALLARRSDLLKSQAGLKGPQVSDQA